MAHHRDAPHSSPRALRARLVTLTVLVVACAEAPPTVPATPEPTGPAAMRLPCPAGFTTAQCLQMMEALNALASHPDRGCSEAGRYGLARWDEGRIQNWPQPVNASTRFAASEWNTRTGSFTGRVEVYPFQWEHPAELYNTMAHELLGHILYVNPDDEGLAESATARCQVN